MPRIQQLGDHRPLPGSENQWLLSGGEFKRFNFGTVPVAATRGFSANRSNAAEIVIRGDGIYFGTRPRVVD